MPTPSYRFSTADGALASVAVAGITPMGQGAVVFATRDALNIRCAPRGFIDFQGRKGPWAQWQPVEAAGGLASYQSVGHRDAGRTLFLASHDGKLVASDTPMLLRLVSEQELQGNAAGAPMPAPARLSVAQRSEFVARGLLTLPGLVDAELVHEALRHINMSLTPSARAWAIDPSTNEAQPAPHVRRHPSIQALLYQSPLFGVVEELLGRATRPAMAQLALRFPNNKVDPTDQQWHIDGMKKWHKSPFQLLVGIALSAQPADDCGNLAVWPGWHAHVHDATRQLRQLRQAVAPSQRAVVGATGELIEAAEDDELEGDDYDESDPWQGLRPDLGTGAATQVQLEPGDVVIAHQKLPHRVSPNRSPHIRYMVYFRISSVHHRPNAPLHGLWEHFAVDAVQAMDVSLTS